MYLCPTSPLIAAQGADDYIRALSASESARSLFVSSYAPQKPIRTVDVQRCFIGVSAEMIFGKRDLATNPRHLFSETEKYVNEQLINFFFFHSPDDHYHLFNLQAVRLIAANYPAYFPAEVSIETRTWPQQNWRMWADGQGENCIRYGLLSGFPLEAVLLFSRQKQTGQRLSLEQVVYSPVTNLSYAGFATEKDKIYMCQLDEIFLASNISSRSWSFWRR